MTSTSLPGRFSLVFLDLDGTLVGKDDALTPRMIAALNGALAAGCTPVVCTGRNHYTVRHITAEWPGRGYAVLANGAIIAEWESGRVLQKIAIPPDAVRGAIHLAHDFGSAPLLFGVHAEDDGGKRVYADTLFAPPDTYLAHNAHRITYRAGLIDADDLAVVSLGVYASREIVEPLTLAWAETLGPEVAVFASHDLKYDCWCAFLNASAADKAHGAARVAEMLGVPRERTLAIGDHLNDLGMLRWAGLGVCMGDGHPDAKACADHITAPLAADGAAQAIEHFILGIPIPPHDRDATSDTKHNLTT